MELELYLMDAEDQMQKAIDQYEHNMKRLSTGRANPQLLDSVKVMYYEEETPLNNIATVSVPEPRQLLVKPFDASTMKDIVAAINGASLGLNAVDEGHQARITLPDMTTERRKDLVKQLGQFTEQAKVGVRNARQSVNKAIKSDEELSEDTTKMYLEETQNLTNKFTTKIDDMTKVKQNDLMTI